MAPQQAPVAQQAAGDFPAAEQLVALKPDATVMIGGEQVTVREYSFFEGLDVAHRAAPFIAAMHEICSDGRLAYTRIRRLFGAHAEIVVPIAAQAADRDATWLRGLDRADAEVFMSAWFGVNSSFFVNELLVEMREERQQAARASTGSAPSPSSPPAASEASKSSDG